VQVLARVTAPNDDKAAGADLAAISRAMNSMGLGQLDRLLGWLAARLSEEPPAPTLIKSLGLLRHLLQHGSALSQACIQGLGTPNDGASNGRFLCVY
jgi:hypothetical protein